MAVTLDLVDAAVLPHETLNRRVAVVFKFIAKTNFFLHFKSEVINLTIVNQLMQVAQLSAFFQMEQKMGIGLNKRTTDNFVYFIGPMSVMLNPLLKCILLI